MDLVGVNMNAKEVELAVVNYFNARQNLIVPNVSWGFMGLHRVISWLSNIQIINSKQ